MPAFIFLSGLFQKDRWELSRVLGFVFIGFALKITTSLVSLLLGWRVSLSLLQDSSVPWFMFALAGYITMSHVLRGVDKRFLLIFSVLLGCFVGYDDSIGDWMYLSRLVVFYPFFILGQMCEREKLTAFSRRPAFRLGGLAVLALWGAVCMLAPDTVYPLRRLFTGRNPFGAQFYPWGFAWRALCYGITLLVGLALLCATPARRLPVISFYGTRTLEIYFWHKPVKYIFSCFGVTAAVCATRSGKLLWLGCALANTILTGTRPFSFPVRHIQQWTKPVRKSPPKSEPEELFEKSSSGHIKSF